MLTPIKFLKIVLPVATVTSATIATVSLVSFKKEDSNLDGNLEDKVLEDFEKPTEKFEEQTMLYAKDGKGDGVKVSSEEEKQKLLEKFKKEGLKDDGRPKGDSVLDPSKLEQQLQEGENQLQKNEGDVVEDTPTSLDLQKSKDNSSLSSKQTDVAQLGDKSDEENEAKQSLSSTNPSESQGEKYLNEKVNADDVNDNRVKDEDVHQPSNSEISDASKDSLNNNQDQESSTKLQSSPENKGDQSAPESEDSLISNSPKEPETLDRQDLQASGGDQNDKDQQTPKGASDYESSSIGDSNGIEGESGQGPISKEQLKRFEEISEEAETALDSLKELLGDNFSLPLPS